MSEITGYDPSADNYAPYSQTEPFGNLDKIGQKCMNNTNCYTGTEKCIKGKCQADCTVSVPKAPGCVCTANGNCITNNCYQGKCSSTDCTTTPKNATCACTNNSDCVSNVCTNGLCASNSTGYRR
jgi:hypothetical protein